MSRLGTISVLKDWLIQPSNTAGDWHACVVGLQREVAPLHTLDRPRQFGPARSVRTRNPMCLIGFSANWTSKAWPGARDRIDRERHRISV